MSIGRNPYFDNAKAILIFLVIFGHVISKMVEENHMVSSLYIFIFLFHIPAFVLISGHFSKVIFKKDQIVKLAKRLLVPYLMLQIFYTYYYNSIFGNELKFSILEPRWALWFLLSLFAWNLMLVFFQNKKYGLLLAVVISLLAGYDRGIDETLSISRTIFYFPFFLLGYYLKPDHFSLLKTRLNVLIGWIIFIVMFFVVYHFADIGWKEWLYGRSSFEETMGGIDTFAFRYRLFMYGLMVVGTYAFLSIVPKKLNFITKFGKTTLIVYLSHMVLVKWLYESRIYEYVSQTQQYIWLFVISAAIFFLLNTKPVIWFGQKIFRLS